MKKVAKSSRVEDVFFFLDPFRLVNAAEEPHIDFVWEEKDGKRRLIGHPNAAYKKLHQRFRASLEGALRHMQSMPGEESSASFLINLPSSTAFKKGTGPTKNAKQHIFGEFFYITDVSGAYEHVNLTYLAALLAYIF
jgi:hypothetical protein